MREREREFVVVDERSMRNVGYNMMERGLCVSFAVFD